MILFLNKFPLFNSFLDLNIFWDLNNIWLFVFFNFLISFLLLISNLLTLLSSNSSCLKVHFSSNIVVFNIMVNKAVILLKL